MRVRPKADEVVNKLFRSSDPVETFLNAYTFCLLNEERANNLCQEEHHDLTYQTKAKELWEMLRAGKSISQIRNAIHRTDENRILLGALALLTALARYIGEARGRELSLYSDPFVDSDGKPYWLALDGPGPFGGQLANPPHTKIQFHSTLREFSDPLLVTPASIGEWTLKRIGLDQNLENYCAQRMQSGQFRIAVSPLSYQAEIHGQSRQRQSPHQAYAFHLTSIEPLEKQLASLQNVLDCASDEGASILVLPELRMPPPLLQATKEFLRRQTLSLERGLLLVAAGSWHITVGENRYNRCVILNHFGVDLWNHDKLREYIVPAETIQDSPHFFRSIGIEAGEAKEAIHRGRTLEFYDSIIGRVAVAICAGFFSPEIEPLLQSSGANIILVPAMTPSITALEARAKALVYTQRAATFVANCGVVGNDKAFCFYQLPQRSAGPSRLASREELLLFDLGNCRA